MRRIQYYILWPNKQKGCMEMNNQVKKKKGGKNNN